MKIISQLISAVRRDPSYLMIVFLTAALLLLMLFEHRWTQPTHVVETVEPEALPDFSKYSDVSRKKKAFFEYLRPLVRQQNQKIAFERAYLDKLGNDLQTASYHNGATIRKLKRLAQAYRVTVGDPIEMLAQLRLRVDLVPESLVLVQAANESAWGTSRFATKASNLFGQWCYSKGCGIVPNGRNEGARHEVRRFKSVKESVASYMRNLNSHEAYEALRQIRSDLRANGQKVTGSKLAQGLSRYSQRGSEYVNELTRMIRQNRLE